MKKLFSILLITVLIFAVSPANAGMSSVMEKILNSWIGYSLDDVINQWGYPDQEKTIAGKKLYYWYSNSTAYFPDGSTTSYDDDTKIVTQTETPVHFSCTRILETDDNYIVKSWEWRGNNCPFILAFKYKTRWLNQQPPRTYNAETKTKAEIMPAAQKNKHKEIQKTEQIQEQQPPQQPPQQPLQQQGQIRQQEKQQQQHPVEPQLQQPVYKEINSNTQNTSPEIIIPDLKPKSHK